MVERACAQALDAGHAAPGERIVITAGVPFGTPGATNVLRIARVAGLGNGPIGSVADWQR